MRSRFRGWTRGASPRRLGAPHQEPEKRRRQLRAFITARARRWSRAAPTRAARRRGALDLRGVKRSLPLAALTARARRLIHNPIATHASHAHRLLCARERISTSLQNSSGWGCYRSSGGAVVRCCGLASSARARCNCAGVLDGMVESCLLHWKIVSTMEITRPRRRSRLPALPGACRTLPATARGCLLGRRPRGDGLPRFAALRGRGHARARLVHQQA